MGEAGSGSGDAKAGGAADTPLSFGNVYRGFARVDAVDWADAWLWAAATMVAMWLAPLVSPALCNLFVLERLVTNGDRAEDGFNVGIIVAVAQWVALRWRGGTDVWGMIITPIPTALAEASVPGIAEGFPLWLFWIGGGFLIAIGWGSGIKDAKKSTTAFFMLLVSLGFGARAFVLEGVGMGPLMDVADALPALFTIPAMALVRSELNPKGD